VTVKLTIIVRQRMLVAGCRRVGHFEIAFIVRSLAQRLAKDLIGGGQVRARPARLPTLRIHGLTPYA
jgi:hypothetical protein